MTKKFSIFTILFWFSLIAGFLTEAQTVQSFRGWSAIFATYKLNTRVSAYVDVQMRSSDEWQSVQTFILRPGINFILSKSMIATIGYAYVGHHRTIDSISGWGPEHRIWEQFIFNQVFTIGAHQTSLQNRLRLEQRFISESIIQDDKLSTAGYNFSQRLRYFVRSIFPLMKTVSFTKGAFVSLQNEVFVNIQNSASVNGKFFDQNRFYTSIGYRVSQQFDIEIGYMIQYIQGRTNNLINNILQLAGYIRL